jgi:hypothetical protein
MILHNSVHEVHGSHGVKSIYEINGVHQDKIVNEITVFITVIGSTCCSVASMMLILFNNVTILIFFFYSFDVMGVLNVVHNSYGGQT